MNSFFKIGLALALTAASAFGAVPDYKAFRGTGGITIVSNPPNGTIVIDGSAISAGVTPSYALTNNDNRTAVQISSPWYFGGVVTNNNQIYFNDRITQIGNNFAKFWGLSGDSLRVTNGTTLQSWIDVTGAVTNRAVQTNAGAVFFGSSLDVTGGVTNRSDAYYLGAIVLTNAGNYVQISAGSIAGGQNLFAVGIAGGQFLQFDTANKDLNWLNQPYWSVGKQTPMDTVQATNFLSKKTINLGGLTTSRVLFTDSSGNATNVTSGSPSTDFVHADGSVGSGGSTTPGGAVGNMQVKQGTSFVGATNSLYDVTNGAFILGAVNVEARRPESSLQITNTSQASIFVDGSQSSALQRMGIRPGSIGTETTTGAAAVNTNWNIVAGGLAIAKVTSTNILIQSGYSLNSPNVFSPGLWGNTVRATNHFQGPLYSNELQYAFSLVNSTTIRGETQHWAHVFTENTQFSEATTSLYSNVVYKLWLSNQTFTATWPGTWNWPFQPGGTAPSVQSGQYIINIQHIGPVTNAWVEQGPTYGFVGDGLHVVLTTNGTTITAVGTNNSAFVNQTIAGVGGANTNFTGQASDGVVYIDGGTTNVNIVAIMPGTTGVTYFPTYIITNLTTTPRQISISSVTNFPINLGQYDGITLPYTITNKHRVIMACAVNGTNLTYTFKQCTNGF